MSNTLRVERLPDMVRIDVFHPSGRQRGVDLRASSFEDDDDLGAAVALLNAAITPWPVAAVTLEAVRQLAAV